MNQRFIILNICRLCLIANNHEIYFLKNFVITKNTCIFASIKRTFKKHAHFFLYTQLIHKGLHTKIILEKKVLL